MIRYLVARTLGVDTKAWTAMSVGHASMTTIRIEADGAATCERLGTVATATALVSAQEETLAPKDEGAEPRSTTTIVGTLLCEVPR